MAIKIHHGPNGSYKTSGAVWDDAVPAAKAGRMIITNVRGMSTEKFQSLFPDLPDAFSVLYIDHETQEGMDRIRTWFQWVPRNAFMIFDEAQVLFPQKWTNKDLDKFDFPGGMDKAKAADRPMNFLDGWTRHRHWNWDVILTTPNIKYVHGEIRQTCEAAYQHSNLMLLGKWLKFLVAKDYKEAMHSAQENKAPSDGSNIVALRKIDKRVFSLYDSTATGQHRDTMAGKNALASPRVVILLFVLVAIFGTLYWRNGSSAFNNPLGAKAPLAGGSSSKTDRSQYPEQDNSVAGGGVSVQPPVPPAAVVARHDPFAQHDIYIKGSIWNEEKGIFFVFQLTKDEHSFNQSANELLASGYTIRARGTCAAELTYKGETRVVTCLGSRPAVRGDERLGSERRPGDGGSSALVSSPAVQPAQGIVRGAGFTVVSDSSRIARTF